MPREATGGHGKSKPEMIRDVLEESPDLPAPRIRAAVWDRFGGEVTAQEIARVRKKMRESQNGMPASEPQPPSEAAPADRKRPHTARRAESPPRKKSPAAIRARDFAGADVTVKQLS